VVALVIVLLAIIYVNILTVFFFLILIGVLFIRLQTSFGMLLVLLLGSEASLGFTHLIKAVSVLVVLVVMVFEDFFLLGAEVLILELGNDLLLLLTALGVLEVVHV